MILKIVYVNTLKSNHDNISFITEDNAELSVTDINTYNNLGEQNLIDKDKSTIFDLYTGIFHPEIFILYKRRSIN